MGLFDRLLGKPASSIKVAAQAQAKPDPEEKSFFLDADASSSLGDVKFMRRSNTIRRTFPGNADSPGEKELVAEVERDLQSKVLLLNRIPSFHELEVLLLSKYGLVWHRRVDADDQAL